MCVFLINGFHHLCKLGIHINVSIALQILCMTLCEFFHFYLIFHIENRFHLNYFFFMQLALNFSLHRGNTHIPMGNLCLNINMTQCSKQMHIKKHTQRHKLFLLTKKIQVEQFSVHKFYVQLIKRQPRSEFLKTPSRFKSKRNECSIKTCVLNLLTLAILFSSEKPSEVFIIFFHVLFSVLRISLQNVSHKKRYSSLLRTVFSNI